MRTWEECWRTFSLSRAWLLGHLWMLLTVEHFSWNWATAVWVVISYTQQLRSQTLVPSFLRQLYNFSMRYCMQFCTFFDDFFDFRIEEVVWKISLFCIKSPHPRIDTMGHWASISFKLRNKLEHGACKIGITSRWGCSRIPSNVQNNVNVWGVNTITLKSLFLETSQTLSVLLFEFEIVLMI